MHKLTAMGMVAVTIVSGAVAQIENTAPLDPTASALSAPPRKRPSFWRRPHYDEPQKELTYAASLEEQGRKRKAARHYRAIVHQWRQRPEALAAQQAYARLLEERGKYERAFEEYQYLIHYYPLQIEYAEIVNRQFALANEVMTTRRMTLFVFKGFEAPERALRMFEQIVANAPQGARAAEAQFRVGWIHEEAQAYPEAADAYATLLHRYPDSEFLDAAAFRRGRCLYRIARQNPRDETACRNALSALSSYINRYASSDENRVAAREYMEELNAKLARMYIERARFYDRTGRPKAALLSYRDFVKKFPDDESTGEAMRRIADLGVQVEQEDEGHE